jgi:hypothetical protein
MEELYSYRQNLLDRLANVLDDLRKIVAAITADAWHASFGADDQTPYQVLAHLRAVEAQLIYPRLMHTSNEASSPLSDEENQKKADYKPAETPEAIFEAYARLRDEELARLRELPPAGWNRVYSNPGYEERTLQWWAEQCLAQAEEHLRQLAVAKPA